jgi:hypothetical protein
VLGFDALLLLLLPKGLPPLPLLVLVLALL